MKKALEVKNLKKRFGGLQALNGVSFDLLPKQVIGLIGPNGCGKSTTFNAITGFIQADEGSVKVFGEEVIDYPTHDISNLGLSRTFQHTRLWRTMTVIENLVIPPKNLVGIKAHQTILRQKIRTQEEEIVEKAFKTLEMLEIDHVAYNYASELSGGQSKLVDIARVLMSDPKILMLDEPVAGVAGPLAQKIFNKILELRNELDLSVVIIEHNMEFILRKGIDNIYVMNLGEIIAEGTAKEIASMQEVIDAYLGG